MPLRTLGELGPDFYLVDLIGSLALGCIGMGLVWPPVRRLDVAYRQRGRDMVELRRAEEKLRHLQKMEALGRLTGGVAHDFNNLLAVVSGNAEMLARGIGTGNPLVAAILHAAGRGASLTKYLLAYLRRQSLRAELFDLGAMAHGMRDVLERSLGPSVRVEVTLAEEGYPVHADQGEVENVLLNLAINARDAMTEGGQLRISAREMEIDEAYVAGHPDARIGRFIALSVADDGAGM